MQDYNLNQNISPAAYTGFSAAGTDFRQKQLSLDELIIKNPAATYFLRAEDELVLGKQYIHAGDLLVVDRAAEIKNNSLVIAAVNEELVLRLIIQRPNKIFVLSRCPDSEHHNDPQETDEQIWGKVIYVLHPVLP